MSEDYVKSNREKSLEPRFGKSWCCFCDRSLVGRGEKCPSCGKKDRKTIKKETSAR